MRRRDNRPKNSLGNFLLFSGVAYYPRGGVWDFVDRFATHELAVAYALQRRASGDDWYQIVDSATLVVIEAVGHSCYGSPDAISPDVKSEHSA